MARVIISEYRAKKILIGDDYAGIHIRTTDTAWADALDSLDAHDRYVVKVDQGEKKRYKRGLIALDVAHGDLQKAITDLSEKGYDRFLLESYRAHAGDAERFLSCELVRDGWQIYWSQTGGVDVESGEGAQLYHISHTQTETEISEVAQAIGLDVRFITDLLDRARRYHLAFVEINPLIVTDDEIYPLDAAVRVDSEACGRLPEGGWQSDDLIVARDTHPAEQAVAALDATTPASLKLSVLNPDGQLFFLLSSGGASIVNVDHAYSAGSAEQIANYGEYSGAPTREETDLYAREVLTLLLASKAPIKNLIISGGVANFTDVAKTFSGIIDALTLHEDALKEAGVKVYVRRGGPHEREGLALMEAYLRRSDLLGTVSGSTERLTIAVEEAITDCSKRRDGE